MSEVWTFNKFIIKRVNNNILLDIDVKNNKGFHLITFESTASCFYSFTELENFENITIEEQMLAYVKMIKRIMKFYTN